MGGRGLTAAKTGSFVMTSSADTTKETRGARRQRVITPARVVALVLIAVVVARARLPSLQARRRSSLRTRRGQGRRPHPEARAPTPRRRAATPPTSARWSCPRTAHDPDSRLIALPVVRIKARTAHPGEPIFRLEGGPGVTNMQFEAAERLAAHHDVVLVGYRGVDGSSVLDAPEVEAALNQSRDLLSRESFRAYGDGLRAAAAPTSGGGRRPRRLHDVRAGRRHRGGAGSRSATVASTS